MNELNKLNMAMTIPLVLNIFGLIINYNIKPIDFTLNAIAVTICILIMWVEW